MPYRQHAAYKLMSNSVPTYQGVKILRNPVYKLVPWFTRKTNVTFCPLLKVMNKDQNCDGGCSSIKGWLLTI